MYVECTVPDRHRRVRRRRDREGACTIAGLPLVFAFGTTVQPDVGKYRVEASGAGYTAKPIDAVDISAANATKVDFTLAP